MNAPPEPITAAPTPRGRMIFGTSVFVVGQLAPLAVPLVTRSDLAPGVKATLTGLLLLGVPELAILAAVAILGKAGFDALVGGVKRRLGAFFKEHGPAQRVSRTRYHFGLLLFLIPILLGWASPYVGDHLPGYDANRLMYAAVGDAIMVVSLFVLGGEFWDKLRSLFVGPRPWLTGEPSLAPDSTAVRNHSHFLPNQAGDTMRAQVLDLTLSNTLAGQ